VLRRLDDVQTEVASLDATDEGEPVIALSTLESATAVPIDRAEYDDCLRRGQLGENLVSIDSSGGDTSGLPA